MVVRRAAHEHLPRIHTHTHTHTHTLIFLQEVILLVEACPPGLRSLCVESRASLTDETLRVVAARAGASLRRLEMPGNEKFTDGGVQSLAERCVKLSFRVCGF